MTAANALSFADNQNIAQDTILPPLEVGENRPYIQLSVFILSIAAGTTMSLTVETGSSGSDWRLLDDSLADKATAGVSMIALTASDRWLRVRISVNGPDPLTVTIKGLSHQLYCTPQDIANLSLPGAALGDVSAVEQSVGCLAATDEAVSYLSEFYDLPLKSWGTALRLHTANMAAYHLLKRRGYSPDNDPTIRQGYTDAIAWLNGPAKSDPAIVDSTETTPSQAIYGVCQPRRGWERDD